MNWIKVVVVVIYNTQLMPSPRRGASPLVPVQHLRATLQADIGKTHSCWLRLQLPFPHPWNLTDNLAGPTLSIEFWFQGYMQNRTRTPRPLLRRVLYALHPVCHAVILVVWNSSRHGDWMDLCLGVWLVSYPISKPVSGLDWCWLWSFSHTHCCLQPSRLTSYWRGHIRPDGVPHCVNLTTRFL